MANNLSNPTPIRLPVSPGAKAKGAAAWVFLFAKGGVCMKYPLARKIERIAKRVERIEAANAELHMLLTWAYANLIGGPYPEYEMGMVRDAVGDYRASLVEHNVARAQSESGALGPQGFDMRVITTEGYWSTS